MEDTILDKCDLEEMKKENLFELYSLVIGEVSCRELTQEFDERAGF